MMLINKIANKLNRIRREELAFTYPKWPVNVFHHIPKCGGSSIHQVLDSWFVIKRDYRVDWTMQYPPVADIQSFRSSDCLCGHWELDGFHLGQRYPGVIESKNYRLFTFIRDPLDVSLSLFNYEKKYGVNEGRALEEHLLLRPNYLSSIFPVTEDNYKSILDQYFFIGILEYPQESMDCLAGLLHKPKVKLPVLNQSGRKKNDLKLLSEEVREQFRANNELDYLVYDYCLNRYRGLIAHE